MDNETFVDNAFFLLCAYIRQTLPDEPISTIMQKVRLRETESANGRTTRIAIDLWDYKDIEKPDLKDLRQIGIKEARKLKREYLINDTMSLSTLHKAVREMYTALNVEATTGEKWADFIARISSVNIDEEGNES